MNEFKKSQIKRNLERTFSGAFFSITPLYSLRRKLNIPHGHGNTRAWDALYLAHTTGFDDMSDVEIATLALVLVDYFDVTADPEVYRDGSRFREALKYADREDIQTPHFDETGGGKNNEFGFQIPNEE